MATSWPSLVRADLAANKAVRATRASNLVDRSNVLKEQSFQFSFTEVTTASTSDVTVVTRTMWIPDWAISMGLDITLEAYRSVGAIDGKWHFAIGGVHGPDTTITATSYAESTATWGAFLVTAGMAGTVQDVVFQARAQSAGPTVRLRSIQRCTAYFHD